MSIPLEEVEKLRQKTGLSYQICTDALERSGGDALDAILYLERTGQLGHARGAGTYTTQPTESAAEARLRAFTQDTRQTKQGHKEAEWKDWAREVGEMGRSLLRCATVNQLEVWRQGRLLTAVPILILVLLLVVAFWIMIPLFFLGLITGCRYRFVGPGLGKEGINGAMDQFSDKVDGVVNEIKREFKDKK